MPDIAFFYITTSLPLTELFYWVAARFKDREVITF